MNKIELQKIKKEALEEHIPIIMDETLESLEDISKNGKKLKVDNEKEINIEEEIK